MKIKVKIIFLLGLIAPAIGYSHTECKRPVAHIWNSMTKDKSVWVTFHDGGGAIYKSEGQITEGQMNRFVSLAITAQTTGNHLTVRYPQDNLSCPPNDTRSDFEGVWLVKE